MDSNERKIVQELVTVLGCVIPASDGYEPRTNLWNKYTAAKNLLAAAPQAVADGPYTFPIGEDGKYMILDKDGQQVGTVLYYHAAKVIAAALAAPAAQGDKK